VGWRTFQVLVIFVAERLTPLDAQAPATHVTPLRPGDLTHSPLPPLSVVKVGISCQCRHHPNCARPQWESLQPKPVPETPFPAAQREVFLHSDCNENLGCTARYPRLGTFISTSRQVTWCFLACFHFSAARTFTFFAVFHPDHPEERPCRLVRFSEGEHWLFDSVWLCCGSLN
jgi:hypothetical protein